ncbi:hypothetical protein ANN_10835 [Periplaneta americana]|uniref:Histone-lysine N-methyltransferase SETMAR n=1 Tax=Periplaneta americana TaxID=6978 RepID=A0ABQ8T4R2_PERAM|nr:hypothetical protein ANN_10835 [Periplaneta americana]
MSVNLKHYGLIELSLIVILDIMSQTKVINWFEEELDDNKHSIPAPVSDSDGDTEYSKQYTVQLRNSQTKVILKCLMRMLELGDEEHNIYNGIRYIATFKRLRAKSRRTLCDAKKTFWTNYVNSLKNNVPANIVRNEFRRIMGKCSSVIPGLLNNGVMTSSSRNFDPEFLKIKDAAEKRNLNFTSDNTEHYNTPFTSEELEALRSQPVHNSYNAFHHSTLYGRYSGNPRRLRPAGVRFRELLSELDVHSPSVHILEYTTTPPWIMRRSMFDVSLSRSFKNFTPDFVYRLRFSELLSGYPNYSLVFTDGSRIDDYKEACDLDLVKENVKLEVVTEEESESTAVHQDSSVSSETRNIAREELLMIEQNHKNFDNFEKLGRNAFLECSKYDKLYTGEDKSKTKSCSYRFDSSKHSDTSCSSMKCTICAGQVPPGAISVAAVVRNGSSYSFSRCRSVIKFFNAQFIGSSQVYGPNIMSKQMVCRWCRQFSEGRQSVHDEECSGRPSLINDDCVELVRQCILENRRFTITELSSHFPQISRSLLHEIVTKHLLFKKVCARWVPKNLTPEHKVQRLGAALTFQQRYHDNGDEFLDRIVTGDEIWISHFTLETKQQSMHWRHSGSRVRTKFKQTLSVWKVMCTVFWDRKGILLIDFLPRGETVNADRYCETLRKLRRAIQNKRRGMLTAGVVLLHDNACPHTARRTAAVLTEFGWELFDHPPYSPDLAPSNFHVFLHLKKFLSSGERFGNDKELKTSVTCWFHSQAAEFYDRGIQKLIPRYDKCLNSDGGYVKK